MLWIYCLLPIECFVRNVPLTISQFNWAETTHVPVYDSSGIDPGTNFYKAVIKKTTKLEQKCYKENFR